MARRLWATGRSNLLTFQTNAAWEQKVRIVGTGVNKEVTGSGEGKIHWQHWTGPGSWLVEAWYRPPDSNDWVPSALTSGRGFGGFYVGADDGAGDGDYQDSLVTAVVVLKSTLESASNYVEAVEEQ